MIITGVRLCGRHLQLRRLLICNCEKLSISARLMQRLHHWPHQLPAGSELIRLLLLMGQRRRRERKGAALSINVPAAPPPLASDTGCSGAACAPPAPEDAGCEGGTAALRTASDAGACAGMLRGQYPAQGEGCPHRSCRRAALWPARTVPLHRRILCHGPSRQRLPAWMAARPRDRRGRSPAPASSPAAEPGGWHGRTARSACAGRSVPGQGLCSLSTGGACSAQPPRAVCLFLAK